MSVLPLRGTVVSAGRLLADGLVEVVGERVRWVGRAADWPHAAPPGQLPEPQPDRYLLPGLVDVHCHGGAGYGFPEADTVGLHTAIGHHLRYGTTSMLGSLVSAPAGVLEMRVRALAPLVAEGKLAGIHLEGPFLASTQCGAQDPDAIVPGDPDLLRTLLEVGEGRIRSMTLAPEIPCAGELVTVLSAVGVLPSFGHTDATAEITRAAIGNLGGAALSATHLFNAMPPMHHRAPGPVAACLGAAARGEMVVELVADGVHLSDETVRTVFDLLGPDRIALVTDAMAAAGMPDGRYPLGPRLVDVRNGVARLAEQVGTAGPGAIAGGTTRLIDGVRRAVRRANVPLVDAVIAASRTPARLLGIDDEVGDLRPGLRADLVVADRQLVPLAVLRAGGWVHGDPGAGPVVAVTLDG